MAAGVAADADEAMGQYPAPEIGADLAPDEERDGGTGPARPRQLATKSGGRALPGIVYTRATAMLSKS